ncbi:hypothetical protein HanRHA438_Chr08g0368931 [Helianthus annuus]|nr:hypothetical protein HanRHA438_Chr08g0368931 [Helianthus annuus]
MVWVISMKQWRFEEVWGFEKLGFMVLVGMLCLGVLLFLGKLLIDLGFLYIHGTCATSGEGLYEGLDWLSNNIANKVIPVDGSDCW